MAFSFKALLGCEEPFLPGVAGHTLTCAWFWSLLLYGFGHLTSVLPPARVPSLQNNPDISKGQFPFRISALSSVLRSGDWALPLFWA